MPSVLRTLYRSTLLSLALLPAITGVVASIGMLTVEGQMPRQVPAHQVQLDAQLGLRLWQGRPFSGVALTREESGQLRSSASFYEGKRHGGLKRWFASGQPSFSAYYLDGQREGWSTSWWANGRLRSKTNYRNDQPHGVAWRWYRSGEPFKRLRYIAGQPAGLQQAWRKNGTLFSNFEIRNGRSFGLRNSNLCVELSDEELSI